MATATNRKHRSVAYPHFGNIINELMHTAVGDVINSNNVDYTTPLVNVIEHDDHYALQMITPGLQKSDVNISIDKNIITISSDKKYEGDQKFKVREFKYGVFKRSFKLPEKVDAKEISASLENGLLEITLGKKTKEQLEAKKITIK